MGIKPPAHWQMSCSDLAKSHLVVAQRNRLTPVVGGLFYFSLANHPADAEGSWKAFGKRWFRISLGQDIVDPARVRLYDDVKSAICRRQDRFIHSGGGIRSQQSCRWITCLDRIDGILCYVNYILRRVGLSKLSKAMSMWSCGHATRSDKTFFSPSGK